MFETKLRAALSIAAVGLLASLGGIYGCSQGDTDGDGNSFAGPGEQYVSDGGAGATLTIRTEKSEFSVGEKVNFFVDLKDPRGLPLEFVRIFCESERGIAIIEPSAGGVAFEHTGPDGSMSGVLGGLLPGSFLFECRAPEGFNIKSRVRLKVTGEVPAGFVGFPGAAGGNMGGGVVIEQPEEGVYISKVTWTDARGESAAGPIDIVAGTCVSSDGKVTNEPFTFVYANVYITNSTASRVFIDTVKFLVADSANSETSTLPILIPVEPNQTALAQVVLIDWDPGYSGTDDVVLRGTYSVTLVATGRQVSGDDFTLQDTVTISLQNVNNCAAK